jgi:DNA polymerase-4
VITPDFAAYREVSAQVMALVRAHVERVEVVGLDEAYLDLGGLLSPRAAMRRLVTEIRERTGLSASVGIGPNKLVAKVASDAEKPSGFVVLTREQACARFAQSPPGLVPGIGPKTAERLQRLGIATLAALAEADAELLAEQFGARQGPWLRARGRFEGSDELEPVRIAVSESRETTFDTDIADAARLEAILRELAAQLCAGLAKHGRRGRTIAIKVRLADFSTVTRARTIAHATDDAGEVAETAVALLREYAPAKPVRLLGVRVASFAADEAAAEPAADQLALPL